jgi:hypothetical protein
MQLGQVLYRIASFPLGIQDTSAQPQVGNYLHLYLSLFSFLNTLSWHLIAYNVFLHQSTYNLSAVLCDHYKTFILMFSTAWFQLSKVESTQK